MLFYRFISENLTQHLNVAEQEAGNADFDYADPFVRVVAERTAERQSGDRVEESFAPTLPAERGGCKQLLAGTSLSLPRSTARLVRG